MNVIVNEIDLEILYKLARGRTYAQIALTEGMTVQNIKNRILSMRQAFGAETTVHLVATLIASDVLRVHDLYTEVDLSVKEYKRTGSGRGIYNLRAMRLEK